MDLRLLACLYKQSIKHDKYVLLWYMDNKLATWI